MTGRPAGAPHRVRVGDDVDPDAVPVLLAEHHGCLDVGDPVALTLPRTRWPRQRVLDVVHGAGFDVAGIRTRGGRWTVRAVRAHTLADTVDGAMRVLVCGLNPSVYSADAGVGFARPGNRFWPAAVAAGLVTRPRDAVHALVHHHVGMTDLVKRATPRADALQPDEYRRGLVRVTALVSWLAPGAVVFVGLAGFRAAVDRHATPGPRGELGGRPLYLMPSTSGLNARSRPADLAEHLRAAARLADTG